MEEDWTAIDPTEPLVTLTTERAPLDTIEEDWTAIDPEPADFITVLTAHDGVLTKRHNADGTSLDADVAKWFSSREVPVAGLRDVVAAISPLMTDPHSCIVTGKLIDGVDPARHLRRKVAQKDEPATLEPAAHQWLPVDYEDKTVAGTIGSTVLRRPALSR
jgi:hypothetical protein